MMRDYRRIIAEDVAEFTQLTLEPEFNNISRRAPTVVLGVVYPAHGNPYAATLNARLHSIGKVGHIYKEVTIRNNHMEGYTKEEINEKEVIVVDVAFSSDMLEYLRQINNEGAQKVHYAFRVPHPGGILELEEMEKLFSG